MEIIKVATEDAGAYYEIVSRLKGAHLRFSSVSANRFGGSGRGLIVTSKREVAELGENVVAIEDLSKEPLIMKGQLLSRLFDESRRDLLVGIDPGVRMGMALFYGGVELGALTSNSVETLVEYLVELAARVPHDSLSVKVGDGEPRSSQRLALVLRERLPDHASIEIVDEAGTSANTHRSVGGTSDQRAAARIAFRKGAQFSGVTRSRKIRG